MGANTNTKGRNNSRTVIDQPQQLDFGNLLFDRKRVVLYVSEIAEKLSITERHVINLIEAGKLKAINVGGENASGRRFYRIPVAWWEDYLRANTL